jgi:hypothetical protein
VNMKMALKTAAGLTIAALLIPHPVARCQTGPTYAGLVLHNSLASPVAVAAGATVRGLAYAAGNLPANGTSYSMVNRAIVFVAAGAASTTCTVGLSDGAVWSAPVSVPANATVGIVVEDKSGPAIPGLFQATGFVIAAGSGGSVTVLPGSSATETAISTQP